MSRNVWVFFYGGLMNPVVMERVGLSPRPREVASVSGFDLTISPWVNLVPSSDAMVFGVIMEATHQELAHVYGQLKATYLPYAVLAEIRGGTMRPALCYIVPEMPPGEAEADHVRALLDPATELGFPEWYLKKIRQYLPGA